MMATSLIYEPFKQLTEEMNQCCVSTQNNYFFCCKQSVKEKNKTQTGSCFFNRHK